MQFLPVCEGIDWESNDVKEAATKIQVDTKCNLLWLSKAGYFGWRARRALAELEAEEKDEEGDGEDEEVDGELGEDGDKENRED